MRQAEDGGCHRSAASRRVVVLRLLLGDVVPGPHHQPHGRVDVRAHAECDRSGRETAAAWRDQWWTPVGREVVMPRPSAAAGPSSRRANPLTLRSPGRAPAVEMGESPDATRTPRKGIVLPQTHIPNHKETGHENDSEQAARRHRPAGTSELDRAEPWAGDTRERRPEERGDPARVRRARIARDRDPRQQRRGHARTGGHQHAAGIPYAITLSGTFTPVGGEPEPFLDVYERRAPATQRLDHCTFHQEGANGSGPS